MAEDKESTIFGHKTLSFSRKGLIKNYAVIPVLMVTVAGAVGAGFYLTRVALKNPDVTWRRRANPEPWQEYENKQYKFFSWTDHENYKHPRPKF